MKLHRQFALILAVTFWMPILWTEHVLTAQESGNFSIQLDIVKQELHPDYCWFHPRVAAVPGAGKDGGPLVVLTLQKHLAADDHYSGLHYMTSKDLGKTWTGPQLPRSLIGKKERTVKRLPSAM